MSCKFMDRLGLLVYYPYIMELAHVWGVAILQYQVKVKLNYENDHRELP